MDKRINDILLVNTAIAFVLFCFLVMESGCAYYKVVRRVEPPTESVMTNLVNDLFPAGQYPREYYPESNLKLILLSGRDVYVYDYQGRWHMDHAILKGDTITGKVRSVPVPSPNDPSYPENRKGHKYSNKTEGQIVRRVNLWVDSLHHEQHDTAFFKTDAIIQYEIYSKNSGKSAGIAIGVAMAIILPITMIALAATATVHASQAAAQSAQNASCPFVYTYDGEKWHFQGDVFAGATMKNIQRNDYLPLVSEIGQPVPGGGYKVRVANMLEEIQYIDKTGLVILEHDPSIVPMIDKYGRVQTISKPVMPVAAVDSRGADCLHSILSNDMETFDFNEDLDTTVSSFSSLILTFNSDAKADSGKFLVSAKNSLWGEYLVQELYGMFGSRYADWRAKREQKPASEHQEWMLQQGLPLQVYALEGNEWKLLDFYNLTGTFGFREMVLSLPIGEAWTGNGTDRKGYSLQLKLVSGYNFWELDYAAIDLTSNTTVNQIKLNAQTAFDQDGRDQTGNLSLEDNHYLVQDQTGEYVDLEFPLPDTLGDSFSIFLQSSGYYYEAREHTGKPDMDMLRTFLEPGKLSRWSYGKYIKIWQLLTLNEK